MACLIREEPVPSRTSSVPTTTSPKMRGGSRGDADTDTAGERRRASERTQGESTQRTAVPPTRVRGVTGEDQSRTSGEDWQPAHGSTAKPGSRGNAAFGWGGTSWHGQHVRDRGVGISPTRRVRCQRFVESLMSNRLSIRGESALIREFCRQAHEIFSVLPVIGN